MNWFVKQRPSRAGFRAHRRSGVSGGSFASLALAAVLLSGGFFLSGSGIARGADVEAVADLPKDKPSPSAKPKKQKKEKQPKDQPTPKQKPKKGDNTLDVPIPVGHGAKGVRLPYYDETGALQMFFNIKDAFRVDEGHLSMKDLMIETYDPDGKAALSINMPSSLLDLKTRIIHSQNTVTIRRADLEVTGSDMTFNSATRKGVFKGPTRTLLFAAPPAGVDSNLTPATTETLDPASTQPSNRLGETGQ